MIRSIILLFIGTGTFIQGVMRLGKPAQAVEQTGWLFQQFGDQGVALGMMGLGIITFMIGAIMFNNTWIKAIRKRCQR
ncbi:hypothetical protein ACLBWZ_17220 [Brucellaceae bacterium C25G]